MLNTLVDAGLHPRVCDAGVFVCYRLRKPDRLLVWLLKSNPQTCRWDEPLRLRSTLKEVAHAHAP